MSYKKRLSVWRGFAIKRVVILTSTIFFLSYILCADEVLSNENTRKNVFPFGFTFTTGIGQLYGGGYGVGVETDYPCDGKHHASLFMGGGKGNYNETVWLYAFGARYSFGENNRIVFDVNYGTLESSFTDTQTDVNYSREYGWCLLVGYQRLTPFGMVFLIEAGTAFNRDGGTAFCTSMGFGYRL